MAASMWFASAPFVIRTNPNVPAVFLFGSTMFFCCIVGAWLGLGKNHWRWLLAIVTPVLLGVGVSMAISFRSEERTVFICMFCGATGLAALTTSLLRVVKGDYKQIAPGASTPDALQFGIRDLLIWTAASAVIIAILKAILGAEFRIHSPEVTLIGVVSVSFSLATVIDIWAIHGQQLTPTKVLVVIVMTCCAMLANYFAIARYQWFFPSVVLLWQILAVAIMLSFRLRGYRFVKRL
ncbi:hypothetical protein UC8_10470 [Roseimaritima ulvae]|uniref:Uncharacterized protein n=1 Tax=Roseimaritima ulvae TaxID=980254 RepID=A0A5B9QPX1_9BACT|nr:hypothetical protein UC8_10470 [Roseimaritima ulvae]